MANNLRVFNTNSEYQSADLVHPAVSYVIETDKVIYDAESPTPPVFQGKWKATYSDSSVASAECDSSSEIVNGEIHRTNLVSVEIGDCVTSIGYGAFQISISLTSIDIPNSVTSIGERAFRSCGNLTSIDIPDSVTSIGNMAFFSCGFTSVTIGSGVTTIGQSAFAECTNLTSVTIGSGVTSIGKRVLEHCASLTGITIEAVTPPTLGGGAFSGTNNCPIYVPSASLTAYQTAWSDYASRIQAIP